MICIYKKAKELITPKAQYLINLQAADKAERANK